MALWDISAKVVGWKYVEIEADTAEEAIERFFDENLDHVHICHCCADEIDEPIVDSDDVRAKKISD